MTLKPIRELKVALEYIDNFEGLAEDFELAISDELNDAMGVNIAIVTDKILARGWMPDRFEQYDGYRVYRYQELD